MEIKSHHLLWWYVTTFTANFLENVLSNIINIEHSPSYYITSEIY